MEELTKGYKKLIEEKELNPKGKVLFEKIIKKAFIRRETKIVSNIL